MNKAIRKDVVVRNESLIFVIASKDLGGYNCSHRPGSKAWNELVRHGIFLPMALVGDRGINLRVIVNDQLTAEEANEASAHFASRLRVRDGCLALVGGCNFLDNGLEHESVEFVSIPRGDYRADIYTCFAGENGPYLREFQDNELGEPLGNWFRRSHPDVEFPRWLSDFCRAHPKSDPDFELHWDPRGNPDVAVGYVDPPEYLDFIVRFTPWNNAAPIAPPEIDEFGFIVSTPIVPKSCPIGITMQPSHCGDLSSI